MVSIPTLDNLRAAAAGIRPYVHETPLVASQALSAAVGVEGWLKLELFQKTGSFKPRGALTHLLRLPPAARAGGVITISAGNHAQGLAFAAAALGVRSTVVMPQAASTVKVDATRGYGAEVVLHGDIHQAFDKLDELRAERGLVFVHPFDHPDTVAGQGTVGLEIIDHLETIDVVIAPIGGGGLVAGVALAVKAIRPETRIVGVEPAGADAMVRSLAAGAPVHLEALSTIADGLAAPMAGALNLAIIRQTVDDVVVVTDDDIVDAMRFLLTRVKVMAEPAGAAAVAALFSGKVRATGRAVCIVSGGNIDPPRFATLLKGGR